MLKQVPTIVLRTARGPSELCDAKELFLEYAHSFGEGFWTQGFEDELSHLSDRYTEPEGLLLVAYVSGRPVGCVALRRLGEHDCEVKRLYVRPSARGTGLGHVLGHEIVERARCLGFQRALLDTLPRMEAARALYRSLGFVETERYNDNPIEGVLFMALEL